MHLSFTPFPLITTLTKLSPLGLSGCDECLFTFVTSALLTCWLLPPWKLPYHYSLITYALPYPIPMLICAWEIVPYELLVYQTAYNSAWHMAGLSIFSYCLCVTSNQTESLTFCLYFWNSLGISEIHFWSSKAGSSQKCTDWWHEACQPPKLLGHRCSPQPLPCRSCSQGPSTWHLCVSLKPCAGFRTVL